MLYEIASSHLARRTFVGNLYKQVKDPNLVGALSGHKEGSRAFARYREIDEELKKSDDVKKRIEHRAESVPRKYAYSVKQKLIEKFGI